MARYRSTGKIRGEVRRLLAAQLAEIDGLVRGLLGVSGVTGSQPKNKISTGEEGCLKT